MTKSTQNKQDTIKSELEIFINEMERLGIMNIPAIKEISFDAVKQSLVITYNSGIKRGYTGNIALKIYETYQKQ